MTATALALLLGSSHALAADLPFPARKLHVDAEAPADAAVGAGIKAEEVAARKVRFEVSFRVRRMFAPQGIISAFGFEDDTPEYAWALRDTSEYCQATPTSQACGRGRPEISATTYGFEFLTKFNRDTIIFYFDWADTDWEDGYWDDREDGDKADDPSDGDYLRPGRNFGAVMAGINYQADIPLVKLSKTRNIFGLDFVAGAGAGLMVLVGDLDRWDSTGSLFPAYEQFDRGDAPLEDNEVGRFWPAVDVNLGFKLNFADRVTLRIEGGLHTLLYFGGTLGFKF